MFGTKMTFGVALALVVLLAACAAEPTATQPVGESGQELENTHWQLVSFDSTDSETPVVEGSDVTIHFDADGQVNGSAGCNSYGGVYRVEQGQITIDEVVSTLMACTDNAIMDQEAQYLTALQTTGEFELNGDRLLIHYGDGLSTLNFVKISE
jgi:heat shock protein HslJ